MNKFTKYKKARNSTESKVLTISPKIYDSLIKIKSQENFEKTKILENLRNLKNSKNLENLKDLKRKN